MNIKETQRFWILLLVLVLAGAGLLAPVKAQEEGDTPRAFAVVPGTPIQVIEIPVSAEEDTPPAFTVPPSAPLQITEISVSPQPYVGQAVTLHIEVMSTEDEPNAAILIDLPKGVELVQGELLWQGVLTANQMQTHEVTIRVLDEGDWRLWVAVQSQIAENSFYGDTETLHLITTAAGVQVVPGSEYRIIQPPEGMPMPEIPPENASVTVDLSARASTTGTVTLEGDFEFDAREYDGGINPPYLVTNALKRVKIEVWDYEATGDRRLDEMTYTPGSGYSVTVDNDDPDGSGIDPFLKIYATDEERVEVVDEANHLYTMPFDLSPHIGNDLTDGTYSLNITFPEDNFTQALYIFDKTADDAYEFLQREVSWGNSDMIQVNWPDGCLGNDNWLSCFTGTQIFITDDSGDEPDVIIHEYGHFALSRDVPVLWVVNACLDQVPPYHHYMWEETSHTCAWSEGWANFFEMAVQNDPDYVGSSLEDVDARLGNVTGDPASYEGVIAATLWDIFDDLPPGAEAWDHFLDGFNGDDGNNPPTGDGIWHFSRNSYGSSSDFWIGPVWDNWRDQRSEGACYGSLILQHHLLDRPPFTHVLTTSVAPSGAGDIKFDPPPHCPQNSYQEDTTVTLKAAPKTGYVFSKWYLSPGGGTNSTPEIEILMTQDWNALAEFVTPTFTPTPTRTPTRTPTSTPTRTPSPTPTNTSTPSAPRGFYPNGITALYYNDVDDGNWVIEGPITWDTFTTFVLSRLETSIDFDLGTNPPAPGVNGTFWSARWSGQLAVPQSGDYVFYFDALDDGGRLYLDGNLELESWKVQGPHSYQTSPVALTAGLHNIIIEYAQGPGAQGSFSVSWSSPFFPKEIIEPSGEMTPTPTPTTAPCSLTWLKQQATAMPDLSLFYRLRDFLALTSEGQRYVKLYNEHNAEVLQLLTTNPTLRADAVNLLRLWETPLATFLDAQDAQITVTLGQVDALKDFIEQLAKAASPELRSIILAEYDNIPWELLPGATMNQAWGVIQGQGLGPAPVENETTPTPQP